METELSPGAFVPWGSKVKPSLGWIVDDRGCHIWTGSRNVYGYGGVRVNGRHHMVHRLRYEREIGPIPEGLELDHFKCDNGAGGCCNPHHCRPVTRRENQLRGKGVGARNLAKRVCPKGHPLEGDNISSYERARGNRKCRICVNERASARRLRDLEGDKQRKREWYRKNADHIKAKQRARWAAKKAAQT